MIFIVHLMLEMSEKLLRSRDLTVCCTKTRKKTILNRYNHSDATSRSLMAGICKSKLPKSQHAKDWKQQKDIN